MPRVLIEDGFTFTFTTKPTDRTPEGVTVKYRPPTPRALAEYDASRLKDGAVRAEGDAKLLADCIGEWNVVDGEDKPVPIAAETFLKVRDWNLINQLTAEVIRSNQVTADEQKK